MIGKVWIRWIMTLAVILGLASCSTAALSTDQSADIVDMANVLGDFTAYRDADISSPSEETLLGFDSQADAAALEANVEAFDESSKALGDGTGDSVDVVENADGTVTVTRSWSVDDGVIMKIVVTRGKKPALGDVRWIDDLIVDAASETRYVNDSRVSDASLSITWSKAGGTVFRYKLSRSGETLKPAGVVAVNTEAQWSADGTLVVKKVCYVAVGKDGLPVEKSFTVETIEIDGTAYKKISTEDREGYAIVKSQKPRLVEYYDDTGSLCLVVRHERIGGQGIVITRDWYENGIAIRTSTGSMRISVGDDGVVSIKRVFGRRTVITTIEETEGAYLVTRNGIAYSITLSLGIATIVSDTGTWTVEWSADGTAVITQIG